LLGSFSVQDDYLTIQFNTAILGHEEYEIEAYALDPSTTLPGLSDDIDRHYISRYVLPMAASFVEVLGDSLGETEETQSVDEGTTTTTKAKKTTSDSLWEAAGESSKTIGEILKENVDKDPTIRVFAGTEAGILFTKTVKGEESIKR
jgi:intracellular multiplication protein IcmE